MSAVMMSVDNGAWLGSNMRADDPVPLEIATGETVRSTRMFSVSSYTENYKSVSEAFDKDDIDTFWFSFKDLIPSDEISYCEFILGDNWYELDKGVNVTFSDEYGENYDKGVYVQVRANVADGQYPITARVTTNSGNRLDRGIYVRVTNN